MLVTTGQYIVNGLSAKYQYWQCIAHNEDVFVLVPVIDVYTGDTGNKHIVTNYLQSAVYANNGVMTLADMHMAIVDECVVIESYNQ